MTERDQELLKNLSRKKTGQDKPRLVDVSEFRLKDASRDDGYDFGTCFPTFLEDLKATRPLVAAAVTEFVGAFYSTSLVCSPPWKDLRRVREIHDRVCQGRDLQDEDKKVIEAGRDALKLQCTGDAAAVEEILKAARADPWSLFDEEKNYNNIITEEKLAEFLGEAFDQYQRDGSVEQFALKIRSHKDIMAAIENVKWLDSMTSTVAGTKFSAPICDVWLAVAIEEQHGDQDGNPFMSTDGRGEWDVQNGFSQVKPAGSGAEGDGAWFPGRLKDLSLGEHKEQWKTTLQRKIKTFTTAPTITK